MNIAVCIKHILDPELPPSAFELDEEKPAAKIGDRACLMDPYSANALETALQLKDGLPGTKVIAITIGGPKSQESLRKAFGVLADEAVHIVTEDDNHLDAYATAMALAAVIEKRGNIDIVICGRQAGDWDAGLVGSLLAEALKLPSVCFISRAQMSNDTLTAWRHVETGTEVLEITPPALLTVTNDESNVLRIAKVKDVMKAHRKAIDTLSLADTGIDSAQPAAPRAYAHLSGLSIPTQSKVCEILEGDAPEDKVRALLQKLREHKHL